MRKLVEEQIIKSFENGLDEFGISGINFSREREGKPKLTVYWDSFAKKGTWGEFNPNFDIKVLVKEATDEELLTIMDSQACLNYR